MFLFLALMSNTNIIALFYNAKYVCKLIKIVIFIDKHEYIVFNSSPFLAGSFAF